MIYQDWTVEQALYVYENSEQDSRLRKESAVVLTGYQHEQQEFIKDLKEKDYEENQT